MLDAVGRERPDGAVVELDRQREDHRALGIAQPLGDPVRDVGLEERLLELRPRLPEERRVPLERGNGMRDLDHGRIVALGPSAGWSGP